MQVPLPGFTVDPGEGLLSQLRDEVITPGIVAVPPAALDALGPGEQREPGFGQPARLEEPCRPRAGLPELVRIPVSRRDAAPGVFRAVVGAGGEAVDRLAAEARLQPLAEPRPVFGLSRGVAEHAGAV